MKTATCQSQSANITHALGAKLGSHITCGGTILLYGELGSGKTTFVQGIAASLGIKNTVTSPTFVLLNSYAVSSHATINRLVHIDLYRITTTNDLTNLDLMHYQNDPGTLLVVEWPEHNALPWHNVIGTITFSSGELNHRIITSQGLVSNWLLSNN